ncbi:MAG: hypothetical protein MN733_39385, partial [Nitrososphaera sp.]|nr:hypothetical protein [Nitrososphaera sp.]
TASKWKIVTIVSANRTPHNAIVRPLFRYYCTGNAWFDQISLRKLPAMGRLPERPVVRIQDASVD